MEIIEPIFEIGDNITELPFYPLSNNYNMKINILQS